jgi:calcineurin-like phosphoesterase
MKKEQKAEMKAYLLELQNDFIITNENEAMIFKLSYEKAFSLNGVGISNCDNGNEFFEEQYILTHLINDTWQVVGEKTKTVWKQGTKEDCQKWLDL